MWYDTSRKPKKAIHCEDHFRLTTKALEFLHYQHQLQQPKLKTKHQTKTPEIINCQNPKILLAIIINFTWAEPINQDPQILPLSKPTSAVVQLDHLT